MGTPQAGLHPHLLSALLSAAIGDAHYTSGRKSRPLGRQLSASVGLLSQVAVGIDDLVLQDLDRLPDGCLLRVVHIHQGWV